MSAVDTSALEARMAAAHAEGRPEGLFRLYAEAADAAAAQGRAEAAGFLRTHAMVFALEAGAEEADAYRGALIRDGRERAVHAARR